MSQKERMEIGAADVGTIDAAALGLASKPKVETEALSAEVLKTLVKEGKRLTPAGNAILVCRLCGLAVDKGCPPIPGQDDSGFGCEGCQTKHNALGLKAELEKSGGPLVLSGGVAGK